MDAAVVAALSAPPVNGGGGLIGRMMAAQMLHKRSLAALGRARANLASRGARRAAAQRTIQSANRELMN